MSRDFQDDGHPEMTCLWVAVGAAIWAIIIIAILWILR